MIDERRRRQKSSQDVLNQGSKLRVLLKGVLSPPGGPVTAGDPPVTRLHPSVVEVYVLMTDYDTEPNDDQPFRDQIVTDEVLKVAIYDQTLPQAAATGKTGLYGHVELIDGIIELTWLGC